MKLRRYAGFTLAEVMAAVAILVILAAVAIPSILALRKNLKMTELDAGARTIFTAAQNNLTGRKTRGALGVFSGLPGTADGTEGGTEGADLCSLSSQSADILDLLPAGAIDPVMAGNHYILVFDRKTATVLDVYYAEHSLDEGVPHALRDNPAARRKQMVGYYGGSNVTLGSGAAILPPPSLEIFNDNELAAILTADLSALPAEIRADLVLTLTVSDEKSTKTFELKGLIEEKLTRKIVLDDLNGVHFKDTCKGITPGADITLKAELAYTGNSETAYRPALSSALSTNSLFAARGGNPGAHSAELTCARHLQNLDAATSGVAMSGADAIASAQQLCPIDWPAELTIPFVPIQNETLTTYDGQTYPIRGLNIVTADRPAGLFGSFNGVAAPATLQNIRLENTRVQNSAAQPTGALVGSAERVTISNCMAYVTASGKTYEELCAAYAVSGVGHTGGLVGQAASCSFTGCAAGLPLVRATTTDGYLGGLIGFAQECTVQNSYASVDQLVGHAQYAAMFIGEAKTSGSIDNCYAVGNLSATTSLESKVMRISGFANGTPAAHLSSCYCAVTYLDESGKAREDLIIRYGFAGVKNEGSLSHCYYMMTGTAVYNANDGLQDGAPTFFEDLPHQSGLGAFAPVGGAASFPYGDGLRGKAYPFPLLKGQGVVMPHYGSWPSKPTLKADGTGFAYCEQYGENSYGVYAVDANDTVMMNTLRSETITGTPRYGVLAAKTTEIESLVSYRTDPNWNKVKLEYEKKGGKPTSIPVSHERKEYLFYPFADKKLTQDPSYCATEVYFEGGKKFYLNDQFGAAIRRSNNPAFLWTADHPLQIRTQAQLEHMPTAMQNSSSISLYLKQTHDLALQQLQTLHAPLTGRHTFDGGQLKITGLTAPLFTAINGATVQNLRIEGATLSGTTDSGILAATVQAESIIRNCIISNADVTGSNSAGFVHTNAGTITNCAVQGTVTGQNSPAAGFVFHNTGTITHCYRNGAVTALGVAAGFVLENESRVTDCYAVGAVASSGSAPAFGFASSGAGCTSCYAAGTLTGASLYGFAPLPSDGTDLSQNCHYMQNDKLTETQAGSAVAPENWKTLAPTLGNAWQTVNDWPSLKNMNPLGAWPDLPPEVTP